MEGEAQERHLTAFQSVHSNQEFITVVNSCSNTFVWSLATVHQTDYVRMLADGHCSSIVKNEVKQRQKALFAAVLVNCHKSRYSFEFVATIEQSLPCIQIYRVTRAWQRIASRYVAGGCICSLCRLALCFFVNEVDPEHHSGFANHFACFID